MNENNLTKKDLEAAMLLSAASTKVDRYIILLKKEYGFTLTKANLANVLSKSEQTLDRRIREKMNIPAYIKSGEGKKASFIFPIQEVAEYLCGTIKTLNQDYFHER